MIDRVPTGREVAWLLGAGLLVGGVVVTFAPGLLPAAVVDAGESVESAVDPWVGVLVLSVVVFLYALARFLWSEPAAVERLVDDDDGASVPDFGDAVSFDPERPGRQFDYEIARTVRLLDRDPNADAWRASGIREELTAAVLAVHDDRERAAVEAAIEDGSWTSDRVAAAFLGGASAPDVAVWRRLYAWFYPARAFELRVERVVAAIERAAERDADGPRRWSAHPDAGGRGERDVERHVERDAERDVERESDPAPGGGS